MFRYWWFDAVVRRTSPGAPPFERWQRRVWSPPVWESWLTAEELPWWLWLAFGLSCIAVGAALVIWPQLLSIVVASVFVAAGAMIVGGAISSAMDAWQRRPRHIHVKRAT